MTTFNSLILPNTIPDETTIRQLLLFSGSIFQFAPAEDSINNEVITKFHNKFIHYAPVPFGDSLESFQNFFNDLTSHRAEYYSGALSHLSAGISTDIDESSVWQLIHSFAKQTSSEEESAQTLMHARLLLKLAEIHDIEESEINAAISEVDSQVNQVMSELKNEREYF